MTDLPGMVGDDGFHLVVLLQVLVDRIQFRVSTDPVGADTLVLGNPGVVDGQVKVAGIFDGVCHGCFLFLT